MRSVALKIEVNNTSNDNILLQLLKYSWLHLFIWRDDNYVPVYVYQLLLARIQMKTRRRSVEHIPLL